MFYVMKASTPSIRLAKCAYPSIEGAGLGMSLFELVT